VRYWSDRKLPERQIQSLFLEEKTQNSRAEQQKSSRALHSRDKRVMVWGKMLSDG
jgi:hypothetical protein